MTSQKIEAASTEASPSESDTRIVGNHVIGSQVDSFYETYRNFGSMKLSLEEYKRDLESADKIFMSLFYEQTSRQQPNNEKDI